MKFTANLQDADAFYEQLLDAHAGLTREQSELLNARLILVLANQIGDSTVLSDCIQAAQLPSLPTQEKRQPARSSGDERGA